MDLFLKLTVYPFSSNVIVMKFSSQNEEHAYCIRLSKRHMHMYHGRQISQRLFIKDQNLNC